MFSSKAYSLKVLLSVLLLFYISTFHAQIINVGNGSYTTSFPGVDSAGRNGFPSGSPQLSGNALNKPVPTNDWWSRLVKENHADNLFNYPMTMRTKNDGLVVTYIPWGPIGDSAPIEVGLVGLNTSMATASDYSDWTVTMDWNDGTHHLNATSGIAMPFIYFEKGSSDIVEISINSGTVTVTNEMITVENASNGADFVIYAPTGSTWTQSDSTYSSSLNGNNYWSMAMLPLTTTNVSMVAQEYKDYAYVFPTNTITTWNYNESNSKLNTTFTVTTDVKEGTETNVLLGLLPHQWSNLSMSSASPSGYSYETVRGEVKMLDGNTFEVEHIFKGILPTLPNLGQYSNGYDPAALDSKITAIQNDQLATWTDSYNEGQVMNRLIQTARIADETGNIAARDVMIATIKERLEDWLTYESGEVAFLYYYNDTWSAMLGYPAGHGQDSNINDHHFHWGYFIHAAAFMEQYEPGWAAQWGDMINLLVRDAASDDRNDTLFPFLRNFSPYAGHSWANGFASFPQGNDQESTSESMQFASSLIHWGAVTDNDAIRDLGIFIYTTEQSAVEEYWFDMYQRNFSASHPYEFVSRVWGNSYDNQTFWTGDIAAAYGIELYPIHGGSLYLGHNQTYLQMLWSEISADTGILSNQENPNLWHDTYWKYLALTDAQSAINLYDSYPNRTLKFGISDAHTYHWLHNMNALGVPDASITANDPLATAFNDNGFITYVAQNYSDSDTVVTFSDGYMLNVPANTLATSRDIDVTAELSANPEVPVENDNVLLSVATTGTGIDKVEFYFDGNLLSEDTAAPYQSTIPNISLGIHTAYAKVYKGSSHIVTNFISMTIGDQLPYLGTPHQIPGVIEAGHYDYFEAGNGQNISYFDTTMDNQGGFRPSEYVDALSDAIEGETVGWIASGEWLEYTVDVQTTGCYNLDIRYASGNNNGGGPIYLEIDGVKVSLDVIFSSTGNWNSWNTKSTSNVDLTAGTHILRLVATDGEINLGRMTFSYNALECTDPGSNTGLPFDFETTPVTADFNDFDGGTGTVEAVSGLQSTGNNSNNLAKIVRDGGQVWSGSYINLNDALNFTTNRYITMRVWTEAPIGTPVQIKLEQQGGGAAFELISNTTVSGQWETLTWDFGSLGLSPYDKLVFMFDIGNLGDGTSQSTFYFDDVQQVSSLSTPEIDFSDLSIYPNPVNEILYIKSNTIHIDKVELYSILGEKLIDSKDRVDYLDMNQLNNGVYFIKVYSGMNYITKKIIKK
ncbi:MAG: carbohydrate-binding protein [Winogradskyella sp.]|uniref:glycosyl hydrolase n=1 Tax=Winogradskyella sp. TaxID=1883156 RepID=UPI0025D85C50|nr:glycosyl hydrolase [Winogradskyella sp.]NRB60973.1 carbohydrate-binding protein [Winogradskyella sp.]